MIGCRCCRSQARRGRAFRRGGLNEAYSMQLTFRNPKPHVGVTKVEKFTATERLPADFRTRPCRRCVSELIAASPPMNSLELLPTRIYLFPIHDREGDLVKSFCLE